MLLRSLSAPLGKPDGVSKTMIPILARLGIRSIAGLLCHYPREWEDRSEAVPIKDFRRAPVCTEVTVLASDLFGLGKNQILKVYVEDESGRASLLYFNRGIYTGKKLVQGSRYRLWGKFEYNGRYSEIQASKFEITAISPPGGGHDDFRRILPVYPLTAGLDQKALRAIIGGALNKTAKSIDDELPAAIIERDQLLHKADAVRAVHFPASFEELERAKKTIMYEELFYLEVMVGKRALARKGGTVTAGNKPLPTRPVPDGNAPPSPLQERLIERLPFALTPGQRQAVDEINRDMSHNPAHAPMANAPMAHAPMARLLQGDVGSGKTLVSFLAALRAVEDGGQAAIMAPTELLARQHAENAARLLEPLGVRIAFLTGNIKAAGRKELLRGLLRGDIDIVVGTHALFSRDVTYNNLRLVVIDEQHRFGVTQRSLIMTKGDNPDLLMMSATPIPRTLALTVFGDMDVSVIRGMPPGRKPVRTHLAKESNEGKVYDFVRNELAAGRQAYFVYPLIENGDEADLKDAVSMAERLAAEVFPRFPSALVHSKRDEEEKRQTMERFRAGEIRILVATSVVEVGVDVPNASCMVVEHAERFGLSALHQLRGRVGRGDAQSYCFLVYSDELTEDGKSRLMVMLENADGFVIAEEDLKLRGPGQIAGLEQSGYLSLGLASPVRNAEELVRARADAFAILESDPALLLPDHRIIARVLEEAPPFGEVTL